MLQVSIDQFGIATAYKPEGSDSIPSQGLKRPGREANHSPLSSVEVVKNVVTS
jgi:hypothetical protein